MRILFSLSMALVLAALTACSSRDVSPDELTEYKRQRQADRSLEIPPDLTRSSIDDSLVVPDITPSQSARYSEYVSERDDVAGAKQVKSSVLPQFDDIAVKRDRDQRWLVIQTPPDQVWPKVVDFWRDNGILLIEEDPSVGVMETGWIENRANIKSDFITDTLRSFLDGLYASGTRDQFRVRLEPGESQGTTELFLTHRGMQEILVTSTGGEPADRPVWQSRPTDPGLEAEMLRRIMVYLGVTDQRAKKALERQEEKPRSRLMTAVDGTSVLTITESFPRAWRLTGVALDRIGFAVQDRNRSEGIYYVRYRDPEADQPSEGVLSKLAFWRDDETQGEGKDRYQISLSSGEGGTSIIVLDNEGAPETSTTSRRILTLLHEQIR